MCLQEMRLSWAWLEVSDCVRFTSLVFNYIYCKITSILLLLTRHAGERMHNFGTRVTFSTQKVEAEPNHTQTNCAPFLCAESESSSKTFVSTTTRIAKGRHRVVKRTATLRPDGKKEVVIEEDGVVIRQYVEDMCQDDQQSGATSENGEQDNKLNDNSEDGHWYSYLIRGMQGVSSLCFAPCSPMLATVAEQDM